MTQIAKNRNAIRSLIFAGERAETAIGLIMKKQAETDLERNPLSKPTRFIENKFGKPLGERSLKVFGVVYRAGTITGLKDVAESLGAEIASISSTMTILVKRRWVDKVTNGDRHDYTLTKLGRAAYQRLTPVKCLATNCGNIITENNKSCFCGLHTEANAKKRRATGKKLTDDQVRSIRRRTQSMLTLATEFGVSKRTIFDIIHMKRYKSVKEPIK
jgi:DNA-binding MarR family transcriptional regulator